MEENANKNTFTESKIKSENTAKPPSDSSNNQREVKKIRKKLEKQVTSRKNKLPDLDKYTNIKVAMLVKPQVDHIVETQIVAHAVINAMGTVENAKPYLAKVKDAINCIENYNVTSQTVNLNKKQVIENFLKNRNGFTLKAAILDKMGEKMLNPLCTALLKASEIVEERIRNCELDRDPNSKEAFEKIASELHKIIRR